MKNDPINPARGLKQAKEFLQKLFIRGDRAKLTIHSNDSGFSSKTIPFRHIDEDVQEILTNITYAPLSNAQQIEERRDFLLELSRHPGFTAYKDALKEIFDTKRKIEINIKRANDERLFGDPKVVKRSKDACVESFKYLITKAKELSNIDFPLTKINFKSILESFSKEIGKASSLDNFEDISAFYEDFKNQESIKDISLITGLFEVARSLNEKNSQAAESTSGIHQSYSDACSYYEPASQYHRNDAVKPTQCTVYCGDIGSGKNRNWTSSNLLVCNFYSKAGNNFR